MEITQGDTLTKEQVLALTACMLSTAHVDGIHPAEENLIRSFYEGAGAAALPAFDGLGALASTADALLARLPADQGFAEQLVLLCFAAGYADGSLSDAERDHVGKLAAGAGVPQQRVAELLEQVKDSLIGALSHLPDAQSVAQLTKEL